MTSIVAVWLKTDSGDKYLILEKDVIDAQDMIARIYSAMNDELAYVYEWEIEVIGDLKISHLSRQLGEKRTEIRDEIDAYHDAA